MLLVGIVGIVESALDHAATIVELSSYQCPYVNPKPCRFVADDRQTFCRCWMATALLQSIDRCPLSIPQRARILAIVAAVHTACQAVDSE